MVTLSVPLPDLVTTPVYLLTVELFPAPVEPTQMMQLSARGARSGLMLLSLSE